MSTHETILCFEKNRITIREIVHKHRACNARVFGSVLHGTDHVGSDLDILIDPTSETTMFDIGAIRHELLQLLSVNVDVLTPNSLPDSFRAKNYCRSNTCMTRDVQRLTDYLSHIIEAIESIEEYVLDMDEISFLNNKLVQDAVIRNLEVKGESSNNIEKRFPSFQLRALSYL